MLPRECGLHQTHPIPRVIIQRGGRPEQRVLRRRARPGTSGGRGMEARAVQAQAVRQARRVGALDRRAQPRHDRVHLCETTESGRSGHGEAAHPGSASGSSVVARGVQAQPGRTHASIDAHSRDAPGACNIMQTAHTHAAGPAAGM